MPSTTEEIKSNHDELLAELDKDFPESWIPEKKGDTIVGVLVSASTAPTQFGPAPVLHLATDEGDRSVWLFYETLKSEFRRLRPTAGEKVAIRYLGKIKAKNPTAGKSDTYHAYRLAVDRPLGSQKLDWDDLLGPVESTPEPEEPTTEEIPF
jgi:hypothetical protein